MQLCLDVYDTVSHAFVLLEAADLITSRNTQPGVCISVASGQKIFPSATESVDSICNFSFFVSSTDDQWGGARSLWSMFRVDFFWSSPGCREKL